MIIEITSQAILDGAESNPTSTIETPELPISGEQILQIICVKDIGGSSSQPRALKIGMDFIDI